MNLLNNNSNQIQLGGFIYFNKLVLETQTMHVKSIEQALIKDFLIFFPSLLLKTKKVVNQLDKKEIKLSMHQLKSSVALFNGTPLYLEINEFENEIDTINDNEITLRSHLILSKSEALMNEVNQFQNENK